MAPITNRLFFQADLIPGMKICSFTMAMLISFLIMTNLERAEVRSWAKWWS